MAMKYFVLFMLLVGMVYAEEGGRILRPDGFVAEPDSSGALAFVPATTSYTVSLRWIADAPNEISNYYGGQCAVKEYISLLACLDANAKSCVRVFSDDYQKNTQADYLKVEQSRTQAWFINTVKDRYMAYECRVPRTSPVTELPGVVKTGKFVSYKPQYKVVTGGTVQVTGEYKTGYSGPFVLMTGINPNTYRALATVSGSSDPCDGSVYRGGAKVNGEAGKTYSFSFTFKAPSKEGKYDIEWYAYTDCPSKGGKAIEAFATYIEVVPATFTQSSCGTTDSDGDTVYDKCDVCPQEKGDPNAAAKGCHPCYGKLPSDSCWTANQAKWGIPDYIKSQMVVALGNVATCSGSTLKMCVKYSDGSQKCDEGQNCPGGCTNGACAEAKYTYSRGCEANAIVMFKTDVATQQKTVSAKLMDCANGCTSGTCNEVPVVSKGTTSITVKDAECTKDSNCPSGEFCEAGNCEKVNDAETTQVECQTSSDCTDAMCKAGYCMPTVATVDNSSAGEDPEEPSCTTDKIEICASGNEVITDACHNGVLVPLGNRCPTEENPVSVRFSDLLGSSGTSSTAPTSTGFNLSNDKLVGLGVIAVVVVLFIYQKKKRGRR